MSADLTPLELSQVGTGECGVQLVSVSEAGGARDGRGGGDDKKAYTISGKVTPPAPAKEE